MSHKGHSFRELHRQAERALADGRCDERVFRMLETLANDAPEGSFEALFAHRQLAELRLETSPWVAALHLRRLVQAEAADDGVFALLGLCHALLGNFRSAVQSYRQALRRSPKNPWYHHNLGHLLDVGLGNAEAALEHLRIAHRIETQEDEITASLAHCLARLGRLEEALQMVLEALRSAPGNAAHLALLEWIEQGAPAGKIQRGHLAAGHGRAAERGKRDPEQQVPRLLEDGMARAGHSPERLRRAYALWTDYSGRCELRGCKPAVLAAAVEYALAQVDNVQGVTQAELARRYGVAPGSISNRYGEIRTILALVPGDPRYC